MSNTNNETSSTQEFEKSGVLPPPNGDPVNLPTPKAEKDEKEKTKKKPFYKKWWFWVVVAVVVAAVALGSASTEMPDVVGMTAEEAKNVLEEAGVETIRIEDEDGAIISSLDGYTVTEQDPESGTSIDSDTKITLVVYSAEKAEEEAEKKAQEEAILAEIEAEEEAKEQAESELKAMLEDLTGGDATEAYNQLVAAGYEVTCKHNEEDWTDFVAGGTDGTVLMTDHGSYSVSAKTVTIKVETKSTLEEEERAEKMEEEEAERVEKLEETLGLTEAWAAVTLYGQQQYPYGFSIGVLDMADAIEEAYDDETWLLKAGCKVTNAYGAKGSYTVEAKVTGTSTNPIVTEFAVY